MKLSSLPVSLYGDLAAHRLTLADWFRLAGELGLDGADVSVAHVPSRSAAVLTELRQQAADAGVAVAILAAYSDFIHPDSGARRREVDDVRRWIEAAAHLGATFLRLTAGQDRENVDPADGLGWVVEGLAACVDAARGSGVDVLFENHVRGAVWDRNDFTQPAARFIDVLHRTAGSRLQVLFDTANNLALGEDPPAVLAASIDRIGAVHVSDITRRGSFEPTVIGTGVAPIDQVLRLAVDHGFDGWISIEEASRTGISGFTTAVAHVERAWLEAGGRPRRAASRTTA